MLISVDKMWITAIFTKHFPKTPKSTIKARLSSLEVKNTRDRGTEVRTDIKNSKFEN